MIPIYGHDIYYKHTQVSDTYFISVGSISDSYSVFSLCAPDIVYHTHPKIIDINIHISDIIVGGWRFKGSTGQTFPTFSNSS